MTNSPGRISVDKCAHCGPKLLGPASSKGFLSHCCQKVNRTVVLFLSSLFFAVSSWLVITVPIACAPHRHIGLLVYVSHRPFTHLSALRMFRGLLAHPAVQVFDMAYSPLGSFGPDNDLVTPAVRASKYRLKPLIPHPVRVGWVMSIRDNEFHLSFPILVSPHGSHAREAMCNRSITAAFRCATPRSADTRAEYLRVVARLVWPNKRRTSSSPMPARSQLVAA
jgi:hypothetical protein